MSTSQSHKQFVRDLKDRDHVTSVFLAVDKAVLTDRNGKPYMSFNLSDASGAINARIWDGVENWINAFEPGDFVRVKGVVQTYQNRKQLIVNEISKSDGTQVDLKDFVRETMEDPKELYTRLLGFVKSMKDDQIRKLTELALSDEEVHGLLLRAPAAKTIHHAYMGGLLEHIVSICSIMDFLAGHYSFLNRDLLLFGAIFHDLGKIWELSLEDGIKYTDRGRLVGHMVLSCELIDRLIKEIPDFERKKEDVLKHIVLSHHGKYEYGSPKEPALIEAMVVAMIDELDSKINTVIEFMRQELGTGERWTRLNPKFDRYFLLDFLRSREP